MNIEQSGYNFCSSCGICKISCPHQAIAFALDNNGFYKPTVLADKCTDCSICTKVCYKYLRTKQELENAFKEKEIYGAWSKNNTTVATSSSGGVGYELSSFFYQKGYNICGVIFDAPNDICKHIVVQSEKDLEAIKRSKYLQSYTIEAFAQFKKDEKYLVIGTPCQIYGLRKYIQLKKWEDNFILIDFFCHGTPSFNLWKKYKQHICKKYHLDSKWQSVNFRKQDIKSKWHSYAISIQDFGGRKYERSSAFLEDLFFKFFLNNSCLNEACYDCKLRLDYCTSDIRIADFWGSKYALNDEGVSLVITNTKKGKEVLEEIKHLLTVETCNFEDLQNSQETRFLEPNKKREIILKELQTEKSLNKIYNNYFKRFILQRGLLYVKRLIGLK